MKQLQLLALCGLVVLGGRAALGQNLVINPGFEQYTYCRDSTALSINTPYGLSRYPPNNLPASSTTGAPGWFSPTGLSARHLLLCNVLPLLRSYRNQARFGTWYRPHTGGGYIALCTYGPPGATQARTYAQGQLTRPLQAGCTYRVSCWVRVARAMDGAPAEAFATASDNLEAYFTADPFSTTLLDALVGYQPQVKLLPPGQLLTDTVNYTYLSRTFVAQGGEEYFTLGNFQPDAATTVRKLRPYNTTLRAMYALDDVAVEAVPPAGLALALGPDQWLGACAGAGPVTLTAPAGFQGYRWSTGQTTASIQVSQPGRYGVTADFGCGLVRDSVEVRRYDPSRTPLLARPPGLCPGQPVTLTAAPGFASYQWADGPTGPVRAVGQPGRYRLLAYTADGCPVRDSVAVALLPPPVLPAGFPADTLVCAGEPYRLTLRPPPAGSSYEWSTTATGTTLYVPAGAAGPYTLTVRTRCQTATATVRVRVQDCTRLLTIPNIITPNGDGQNDQFRIPVPSPRSLRVQVYTRWGQPVFEAADYHGQWPAGSAVAAGVYYYLVVDDTFGRRYRGWVEVVR